MTCTAVTGSTSTDQVETLLNLGIPTDDAQLAAFEAAAAAENALPASVGATT